MIVKSPKSEKFRFFRGAIDEKCKYHLTDASEGHITPLRSALTPCCTNSPTFWSRKELEGRVFALFYIVKKWKGCAGGGVLLRNAKPSVRIQAMQTLVLGKLNVSLKYLCFGGILDQLESLILAQNERWRQA